MLLTELFLEGILEVTPEMVLKVTTQEIQADFIKILTEVEDKVTPIEVEDKAEVEADHLCIIQTNMD